MMTYTSPDTFTIDTDTHLIGNIIILCCIDWDQKKLHHQTKSPSMYSLILQDPMDILSNQVIWKQLEI